ncbi:C1-like protein [Artemisia annua]|uniref:C1-like protein n=1 Tax=Artemisia annua TaxID=35608 RepID=A0A2U1LWK0_ARTAN|nr:C1-like protein [Artemisia annua]
MVATLVDMVLDTDAQHAILTSMNFVRATCPNYISSNAHPGHQLVLLIRPPNSHRCDVCSFYTNGLSYTCGTCDFDAHPLCTQIPATIPAASFGGYHGVNNYHPVMINQQRHQKGSSNHSKVGKFATKLLPIEHICDTQQSIT